MFRFELALPVALVVLQLIWSLLFPQLSELPQTEVLDAKAERPKGPPELIVQEVSPVTQLRSVKWFSTSQDAKTSSKAESTPEEVLPLFPLNSFYALHSSAKLKIFEPRYRQLYSESPKRLAVTRVSEMGELASVGVVLKVEEVPRAVKVGFGEFKSRRFWHFCTFLTPQSINTYQKLGFGYLKI